jgi:hypothetical protein
MLRVLRAVEEREGCGANHIADVLFPDTHRHMSLRAGQYMGRLRTRGLIRRHFEEYHGKHGQLVAMSVSYSLTPLAREILKSEA